MFQKPKELQMFWVHSIGVSEHFCDTSNEILRFRVSLFRKRKELQRFGCIPSVSARKIRDNLSVGVGVRDI